MAELINGRTAEEIIFNVSECARGQCLSECPHDHSDHCTEDLLCDAIAVIRHLEHERDAALDKQQKWIDVRDGLPDAAYDCIVHIERRNARGRYLAMASYVGKWDVDNEEFYAWPYGDVTHWMPVYDYPEEDE